VAQLPASGGTHRQLAVSRSREGAWLRPWQLPARPEVSHGGSATCVCGAWWRSSGGGGATAATVAEKGEQKGRCTMGKVVVHMVGREGAQSGRDAMVASSARQPLWPSSSTCA